MTSELLSLPWYDPADYVTLRAAMEDGDKMPASYEGWVPSAQQIEGELQRLGRRTRRVVIRPEPFLAWCREAGMAPNGAARHAYAKAFDEGASQGMT